MHRLGDAFGARRTLRRLQQAESRRWDRPADLAQAGLQADVVAYNAVLDAYVRAGDLRAAGEWFYQIRANQLVPSAVSYNLLVGAYGSARHLAKAVRWFQKMLSADLSPDVISCNALLHGCAKAGRPWEAEQWLRRMEPLRLSPDEISYTGVIGSFARANDAGGARRWLQRMEEAQLQPDEITYTSAARFEGGVVFDVRREPGRSVFHRDSQARFHRAAARGPSVAPEVISFGCKNFALRTPDVVAYSAVAPLKSVVRG
ncbi:unnamed protein product [Effrenium voratum]|nr:unnamed protein product [Effrenium voratum]